MDQCINKSNYISFNKAQAQHNIIKLTGFSPSANWENYSKHGTIS